MASYIIARGLYRAGKSAWNALAARRAANVAADPIGSDYRRYQALSPMQKDIALGTAAALFPFGGVVGHTVKAGLGAARYWNRRSAYGRSYPPRWQTATRARRNGAYTGKEARYRRYGATLAFNGPGALTKTSLRRLRTMDRTTRQAQRRGLTTAFRGTSTQFVSRRKSRPTAVGLEMTLLRVQK